MVKMIRPSVRTLDTRSTKPPPKTADTSLLDTKHRDWRQAVLQRAGYRCEAVIEGTRCVIRSPHRLFADHIVERKDGGDPYDIANGQCLCGAHHTLKTLQARAARLRSP